MFQRCESDSYIKPQHSKLLNFSNLSLSTELLHTNDSDNQMNFNIWQEINTNLPTHRVLFNFTKLNASTITITNNQLVRLIAPCDQDKNFQWSLVEIYPKGTKGYVPSTYIQRLSNK